MVAAALLAVVLIGRNSGWLQAARTIRVVTSAFFINNSNASALQEILKLVSNDKYVDKVGTDSLKDDAINDMLGASRPTFQFTFHRRDLQSVNEDLQGNFEGIGVEFQIFDDTINVVNVLQGGPSDKAGVEAGDKMIRLNDTVCSHRKPNIVPHRCSRTLLRGEGGSTGKNY